MPCRKCKPGSKRPTRESGLCATHEREERNRKAHRSWESHIRRTYGISADDYLRILARQGGRCAICGRANGRTRRLSVDHDHKTGIVRGAICRVCNDMLGHLRDDPGRLRAAAEYLEHPPAVAVLGEVFAPRNRRKGWT